MVCGLLIAGCGGGPDGGSDGEAAPSPAASASTTSAPGGLSDNDRLGYMTRLAEIDPDLARDETLVIQAGRETCADIAEGMREARLLDTVRSRFSAGGASLDAARARRVITVVREQLCRS